MTDTSVVQQRIGEQCHQFKLPTMGARSASRFTAAGHGDTLATFLEVLEEQGFSGPGRPHRPLPLAPPTPLFPQAGSLY